MKYVTKMKILFLVSMVVAQSATCMKDFYQVDIYGQQRGESKFLDDERENYDGWKEKLSSSFSYRLILLIKNDAIDEVKDLIRSNPERINDAHWQNTPLSQAILYNRVGIALFLLEQKNIKVNNCPLGGSYPISLVRDVPLCKKLLECGASLHQRNEFTHYTAFMSAVCYFERNEKVLEVMLQHGANPNDSVRGESLLMRMVPLVYMYPYEHFEVIIRYGALVTDEIIKTAIEKKQTSAIIQLLKAHKNAVKCAHCPKWYSELEHKNQITFVCSDCMVKDKTREIK